MKRAMIFCLLLALLAEPPAATGEKNISVAQGCRGVEGMCPVDGSEKRLDTAAAVFLYEMTTDTLVYAYNPDAKLPCGHLAKIVTAMVVLDRCQPEVTVTVAPGIKSRLPASSLTMDLTGDEELTVKDLLHGLLMVNASDAAVALAEHTAGSRDAFTSLMNQWARDAGCQSSSFASPHGIDGGTSVSSARDVAKLLLRALKEDRFAEIFGTAQYTVPPTNKSAARSLQTLNYVLDNAIIPQFYDTSVSGGMASFEPNSGASLVEIKEHDGKQYLAVVLGCTRTFEENGWQPKIYGNFEEMAVLLKYACDTFKTGRIVYEGMTCGQFPVENGDCEAVGTVRSNVDSAIPKNVHMRDLIINYRLNRLTAPISQGQSLGTMEIWYQSSCLLETEIFSMGEVRPADSTGLIILSPQERAQSRLTHRILLLALWCAAVLAAAVFWRNRFRHLRKKPSRRRRTEKQ